MLRSLSYQARHEVIERMAPCYRAVSGEQKGMLLDTVVDATGYVRKYAIALLNHESARKPRILRPRLPHYGFEVQHALVLAWEVTKRIYAKCLIPFLPTLVNALERHGHLQLTQEHRHALLSMSVATAERVLCSQPTTPLRGLCTTKAGPLLKQQIPIRTFQQWDDTTPGFLEADLVAHGGGQSEGGYVSTLSLTDMATGWTECLPLLYKGPDAVLAAFHHARQLFPFPILGLDTDNGGEFINHDLLAYCEREQITFTRGRPEVKNDHCFIEQKNGAIVRRFVGYDRLTGLQAYVQLGQLYRGVRLLVNCFQPSMKLQSKYHDGQQVRRVYDTAKTSLQGLLLSGVLPTQQEQTLREAAFALDPVHVVQQVEQLQQAVWQGAVDALLPLSGTPASCILPFSSARAFAGLALPSTSERTPDPDERAAPGQEPPNRTGLLDWPRSTRDPFRGEWEHILSLILAHPERSSGAIFQELQRILPGRYAPSHLSTLQHGIRTIRARLLATMEEPWSDEVIQAARPDPIVADLPSQEATLSSGTVHASTLVLHQEQDRAQAAMHQPRTGKESEIPVEQALPTVKEPTQERRDEESPPLQVHHATMTMTIEGAIQAYLQDQRAQRCTRKTLEWHQTALRLFQQYLVTERHLLFLSQITGKDVED